MQSTGPLANLSERQLLNRFSDLVHQDQRHTAQLLTAIAEIDERKLWAKRACPSMFAFCVERFHMSESMAGKRIWAARTARRYPVVLQMVARGELHLSGIVKIAKYLTADNHRALLAGARHKSSREIDLLIAEVAPRPDVPSRIRALPRTIGSVGYSSAGRVSECTTGSVTIDACTRHDSASAKEPKPAGEPATHYSTCTTEPMPANACTAQGPDLALENRSAAAPNAPRHRSQVVALAPRRYKIEITVDQQTHDKLRTLQDLLGHRIADADPAIIVSRAIDSFLDDTLKKKAALTDRTRPGDRRKGSEGHSDRRTRAIPAAIRREVWQRDGGRCTFVDDQGRRCRATRSVEYHHEKPYGKGGRHRVDNIALRCRAHNQYQADLDFGREFMREKRSRDSQHSARNAQRLYETSKFL
jgi:5-methylcytosine-specific restriction endonuclease McrA